MNTPHPDERGTASVEAVLLIPAVLLLLGLALVGGRFWYVQTAVEEAAWTAARAASLERTPHAAQHSARKVATENLRGAGTECRDLELQVDGSALTRRAGQPSAVTVHIECRVPLADLLVPGAPGSIAVSTRGDSTVDRYRGRS